MPSTIAYNEKELLQRVSAGDEIAFRYLYNKHWSRIFTLALVYLKSRDLAQDIVQDVFLKIWIKRQELTCINNFESFVFIIGRNAIIDMLRKVPVAAKELHNSPEIRADSSCLPDEMLQLKQSFQFIRLAIEELPPQQRLVFKLSREEGLSYEEIAQRLGIIRDTVKNHMVRALHSLKRKLPDIGKK